MPKQKLNKDVVWNQINNNQQLKSLLGLDENFNEIELEALRGGFMSKAYRIIANGKSFFVKFHTSQEISQSLFETENIGLDCLRDHSNGLYKIPKVLGRGNITLETSTGGNFILLEWIDFKKSLTCNHYSQAGRNLAQLHLKSVSDKFGFQCNNFFGTILQDNTWCDDWSEFFTKYRLMNQIDLLRHQINAKPEELVDLSERLAKKPRSRKSAKKISDRRNEILEMCVKLIDLVPNFFKDILIKPSLLHGDLTTSNWSVDKNDEIVIYDPVPIYGHHEFELCIMPLWGNPTDSFYKEYHKLIPKEKGFEKRQKLYQLYFQLHHLNMLGLAYQDDCLHLLQDVIQSVDQDILVQPSTIKTPIDKLKIPSTRNDSIRIVLVASGSFAPIHLNHVNIMEASLQHIQNNHKELEVIGGYLVPAPDKQIAKKLKGKSIPLIDRINMAKIATNDTMWMIDETGYVGEKMLSKIEKTIKSNYGIDVVAYYVCGGDVISRVNGYLATSRKIVCVQRNDWKGEVDDFLKDATESEKNRVILVSWNENTISSTLIRKLLSKDDESEGTEVDLIKMLHPGVIKYIHEHNIESCWQ